MAAAGRETEIKLPFPSAAEAARSLLSIGARLLRGRELEDNVVYDSPSGDLRRGDRLLRLRRAGGVAILTYKEPVEGGFRHKVREEHETRIEDAGVVERILEALGLVPWYRYQKYRSVFEIGGLEASVDETPLGCFVELEGEDAAIDRIASALGFGPERYVVATYRQLHEEAAAAGRIEPGDLVFP